MVQLIMPRAKTRITLKCPNCSKEFEIIRSRLKKSKNHYCSVKCLSCYTAKTRADKIRKRKYPCKCGVCLQCGQDIIAKNASFYKSTRKFCSKSCKMTYQIAMEPERYKLSPESIEKARKRFSKMWRGKPKKSEWKEKYRLANLGSKSHFWRGGKTSKNRKLRNMAKTSDWRNKVFERDNYTCQRCGARNGSGKTIYLTAHHIKSWAKYPKLRWTLNNGITLCRECHKLTDNFGFKAIIYKSNLKA